MRIMIVGAGLVGYHLCEKLSAEGQEVVLVDRDESKLRRLERELNILTVAGSGASAKTLEEAGIDKTDLFIAVTDSDEVNLVACIMSKQYEVKKRIARVRNEDFLSPGLPLNLMVGATRNPTPFSRSRASITGNSSHGSTTPKCRTGICSPSTS